MTRNTAFYRTLLKHRKPATLITRTRSVNPATGAVTLTEQKWSGDVAFVVSNQMPRNDQVVVTDAWVVTDQPLEDKTEIHVAGKAYVVLKLADMGDYCIASLKAVAPAEIHLTFRGDLTPDGNTELVPPDHIYASYGDNHEFTDEMSSSVI